MEGVFHFQLLAGILVTLFLYYGMDVRRKRGARNLATPVLVLLMKGCSALLIGAWAWVVLFANKLTAIDWMSLALMASGVAFVVAAKTVLGKAHTFTGQCLERPELVTHGVYGVTRNPLYLGVFLCELGAVFFVVHQAPNMWPNSYPYWLVLFSCALTYAVSFNWRMALREAGYLESYFGERYRQYRARVPFLIPFKRLR